MRNHTLHIPGLSHKKYFMAWAIRGPLTIFRLTTCAGQDSLRFAWSGYLKQLPAAIHQPFTDQVWLDRLVQHRLNCTLSGERTPWSVHAGLRTRLFYGDFFEQDDERGQKIHDENNDYLTSSLNVVDGQ